MYVLISMEHAEVLGLFDEVSDAIQTGQTLLKSYGGIGHIDGCPETAMLRVQNVPKNRLIAHCELYGQTIWDSVQEYNVEDQYTCHPVIN